MSSALISTHLLRENYTWKCRERIPIGNPACWEDSSFLFTARATAVDVPSVHLSSSARAGIRMLCARLDAPLAAMAASPEAAYNGMRASSKRGIVTLEPIPSTAAQRPIPTAPLVAIFPIVSWGIIIAVLFTFYAYIILHCHLLSHFQKFVDGMHLSNIAEHRIQKQKCATIKRSMPADTLQRMPCVAFVKQRSQKETVGIA